MLLGDLGVAASLTDEDAHANQKNGAGATHVSSSRDPSLAGTPRPPQQRLPSAPLVLGKRRSFVGTLTYMAPEVLKSNLYDTSADIWSLGITALELCYGRPPYSRDPPGTVLRKVLNNEAPTLDRSGGRYKYSKAFKEVIDSCLVKDPSQRPTAADLLQTPFFKGTKKKIYLVSTLLGRNFDRHESPAR